MFSKIAIQITDILVFRFFKDHQGSLPQCAHVFIRPCPVLLFLYFVFLLGFFSSYLSIFIWVCLMIFFSQVFVLGPFSIGSLLYVSSSNSSSVSQHCSYIGIFHNHCHFTSYVSYALMYDIIFICFGPYIFFRILLSRGQGYFSLFSLIVGHVSHAYKITDLMNIL